MDIIPKDTRYVPLTQQRWCCVPTCIQIVMLRHSIPLLPAELIGYYIGLTVPPSAQTEFWHPRTGPQPPAGYGTQASKPQYGPNAVFRKLGIPLTMRWDLISQFPKLTDFEQYLEKLADRDFDILICFDWGTLFDQTEQTGHVCVLDVIDRVNKTVRIIDPEYGVPKWCIVPIAKLYQAMKVHGREKSGGFWVIEKKT